MAQVGERTQVDATHGSVERVTLTLHGDQPASPAAAEEPSRAPEPTAHHSAETKRALGNRLRRIEGQIRGIARMVEQDVYCDEVLNQVTSVEAALNGVRMQLLEAHVRSCVVDQLARGELAVVDELMKTIGRMVP
jgi:CsoR family transcriptional regulator, copper-sensing transcriptional repressor